MIQNPPRRRVARTAARAAALISAGMLAISLWTVGTARLSPAGAAGNNGAASIVGATAPHRPLRSGGSATPFNLKLGANPVCPGDSSRGNFRVQSFMVPSSADLDTMTFGANGPVAVSGELRQPLFDATTSPYVNELTDVAVPPAVTGRISGLPAFAFEVFTPGGVPAGDYSIGIACTLGPAGPTQLETYWSTTITVTPAAADVPAGFTWAVPGAPATTRGGPSTTTPAAGDPSTTTTTAAAGGSPTTTTTAAAGGSPTSTTSDVAFAGAEPSDPSVSSTLGQLRLTGSSPWYFVVWGLGLIVFGRVAVLLARRPKVLPPSGD